MQKSIPAVAAAAAVAVAVEFAVVVAAAVVGFQQFVSEASLRWWPTLRC